MTSIVTIGVLLAAAPPAAPAKTYALIVANNTSLMASRPALQFADDDGVRYAELFGLEADSVKLYTVLDRDTQGLYPELAAETEPPRKAAVLDGARSLFAAMRADVVAGIRVVFYFVFSGHGDVGEDGEGYVHFLDAPFSRRDLFEQVVAASPATVNHLIIDACNAYFMVAARGAQARPAGDYSSLIRELVGKQQLAAYPNTGVILSTSSAAEVHEWGRIEAGIFSHELRSALAGAADANGDGQIDYGEVAAFIAAANGALPDPKTRLTVFAAAPAQNLAEPVFAAPGRGARLEVPKAWAGRYYLEDDRGRRFADFNKQHQTPLALTLVPRPHYFLRSDAVEYRVDPAADGSVIAAGSLAGRSPTLAARGSANDAFERYLFAIPFGPEFVTGFRQAQLSATLSPAVVEVMVPGSALRPWRYGTLAAGGTLAVASGVLELWARVAAADYRDAAGSPDQLADKRARAEAMHTLAMLSGGVSVISLGAAAVLSWLDP